MIRPCHGTKTQLRFHFNIKSLRMIIISFFLYLFQSFSAELYFRICVVDLILKTRSQSVDTLQPIMIIDIALISAYNEFRLYVTYNIRPKNTSVLIQSVYSKGHVLLKNNIIFPTQFSSISTEKICNIKGLSPENNNCKK